MDDADAEADTDGDEINATACGCSWGWSVNPVVDDAAAVTVILPINEIVATVNANISNTFDVIRMILDAFILYIPLLNIVPMDILSFPNPPVNDISKKKDSLELKWNTNSSKQFKCSCQEQRYIGQEQQKQSTPITKFTSDKFIVGFY